MIMLAGNSSKKTSITWQRVNNVEGHRPEARYSFSVCYHYETKQCLILGGRNDHGQPFDDKVYSLMVDITAQDVKARWKIIESSHSPGCIADHCCVCVRDSMFLFGGQDDDEKYLNSLYKMDIKSGQWNEVESKGTRPTPRSCHSMTSVSSRIYIFGGCNESGVLNDLYFFDLKSSSWHEISTLSSSPPSPVRGSALLGMRNTNDDGDLLCLVFGSNAEHPVNDMFTYGSNSNEWSSRPSRGDLKNGRCSFMSSLLMAGKIFLFGGDGDSGPQNDSYIYNVLSGGWTRLQEDDGIAPSPRSNMGGFKQGLDKVVVFGGVDDSRKTLNDLWLARL